MTPIVLFAEGRSPEANGTFGVTEAHSLTSTSNTRHGIFVLYPASKIYLKKKKKKKKKIGKKHLEQKECQFLSKKI